MSLNACSLLVGIQFTGERLRGIIVSPTPVKKKERDPHILERAMLNYEGQEKR